MAVLLLLLCLGLLIFAATRYDWALVAFIVLIIAVMAYVARFNYLFRDWDGI